ncbi:uncharacterized protein LOC121397189 [Xenopus laevis]|uniref:Uncharacterized protein LOC121397189 n=2 Tax=Xenopus laevis TaxID=8355 RepID=A0A1L8FC30_XENLA|nr:uncharacterized protein LOC121397189 [Xenopus laevis]OCT69145.1 hypothetical protein XELAEV_18040454mg [Xenopus laevis]
MCTRNNNPHKYLCNTDANRTSLEIFNGQKNDSGIYYCSSLEAIAETGVRLIVGDASTSNTTVHLLAPKQVSLEIQTIHLTCVVHSVQQIIHLIWNISGTHHKGNVIAMEDPTGTWNFLNHITVDRTHWHNGTLACEVHFNSTVISDHLVIEEMKRSFGKRCSMYLIPVLTGIIVLLTILLGHLLWIFKQPGPKKTERETTVTDTQDGIVYAELSMGSLNPKINK